jgi:hypothetical protein
MSPPEIWGPAVWTLFHVLAERINEQAYSYLFPSMFAIIKRICKFLPCPECSNDATKFLAKLKITDMKTKLEFKNTIYLFHNYVNAKKRKRLFNYGNINIYKNYKIVNVVNRFLKVYNTKGNMNLLTESFQRQFVINDFKKWISTNIKAFVNILIPNNVVINDNIVEVEDDKIVDDNIVEEEDDKIVKEENDKIVDDKIVKEENDKIVDDKIVEEEDNKIVEVEDNKIVEEEDDKIVDKIVKEENDKIVKEEDNKIVKEEDDKIVKEEDDKIVKEEDDEIVKEEDDEIVKEEDDEDEEIVEEEDNKIVDKIVDDKIVEEEDDKIVEEEDNQINPEIIPELSIKKESKKSKKRK